MIILYAELQQCHCSRPDGGAQFGNAGKLARRSSRVANVICTKGTRHGRPFGDQLKWQTVPGRRHGDPESSSVLVNRPLSSLTTSNVPHPLTALHATRTTVVLCAPRRHRRTVPPLYTVLCCCAPPLPHIRTSATAAAAAAADSFVRSRRQSNFSSAKQTRQSPCAYTPTHPHARIDYTVYMRSVYVAVFTWVHCPHASTSKPTTRFFSPDVAVVYIGAYVRRRRFCVLTRLWRNGQAGDGVGEGMSEISLGKTLKKPRFN